MPIEEIFDSLPEFPGTLGDLYQRGPDGPLIPVPGDKTEGYVPTVQADGSLMFEVGGTGGAVSDDIKDVWTLLPIGNAADGIPTGLWPCPAYLPPGTIQEVSLFGKEISGSIVLDLWADVPANWPPTIADTIVASAKPTITTAQSAVNVSRTGWTDSTGSVGKMLYVNVESVTNFTLATLWVRTRRT